MVCTSLFKQGTLHRNFMGYTSSKTQVMIGLGVSSISDSWYSFAQNEKNIDVYYECVERNKIPVVKGGVLRQKIENSSAHFEFDVYV